MANSLVNPARKWTWMNTTWLLFAAITAALTLFVWIASRALPEQKADKKADKVLSVTDPLLQLRNRNPNELTTEVKPISFDTVVRDLRNYPAEFKDSRYLKANVNKWTIQIMNVAEPEVIADYLKGRDDRDKFVYFRIVDERNQKRYVLTYGLLNSTSEASAILSTINFNLPNNVKAFPEQIKLYTSQVDDYEVAEPMKDLSANAPREVKLHTAPKLIPAPKAKPAQTTTGQPTPARPAKPPTDQTAVKPTKTTIKESVDKTDTLSIQEKRVSSRKTDETQAPRNTTVAKSQDNAPQTPPERPKEVTKPKTETHVDSIEKVITEKTQ